MIIYYILIEFVAHLYTRRPTKKGGRERRLMIIKNERVGLHSCVWKAIGITEYVCLEMYS
jgi:hypothetical protein